MDLVLFPGSLGSHGFTKFHLFIGIGMISGVGGFANAWQLVALDVRVCHVKVNVLVVFGAKETSCWPSVRQGSMF